MVAVNRENTTFTLLIDNVTIEQRIQDLYVNGTSVYMTGRIVDPDHQILCVLSVSRDYGILW
jgi:hypothetical protein